LNEGASAPSTQEITMLSNDKLFVRAPDQIRNDGGVVSIHSKACGTNLYWEEIMTKKHHRG